MIHGFIDLRSDTSTLPSPAMRQAMAQAEVGDDVLGEDPTVNQLEEQSAKLLGKEAALFVPSGTMANQIAVRIHTRPGDEVLCEQSCHVFAYEGGAPAMLSGVSCRTLVGRRGILDAEDFEAAYRGENIHYPRTRLVAIENTHNRGGGSIYPLENIQRICDWARDHGMATHLDGARLCNAVVASGIGIVDWTRHFDTVSLCFSKGLGAPVGSVLAGPQDLIREARRFRKALGGGMRQAGILAAACLFALDHNVDRLADDHANAQIIARSLEQVPAFDIRANEVETNLIWVNVDPARGSAAEVVAQFKEKRILISALGKQTFRMCTHLDVSREDAERVAEVVASIV